MLTPLSTLKSRLALLPGDTTYDTLLTSAILAVSARFDLETNRTLARTENATHEFDPATPKSSPPVTPSNPSPNSNSNTTKPTAGSNNRTPST